MPSFRRPPVGNSSEQSVDSLRSDLSPTAIYPAVPPNHTPPPLSRRPSQFLANKLMNSARAAATLSAPKLTELEALISPSHSGGGLSATRASVVSPSPSPSEAELSSVFLQGQDQSSDCGSRTRARLFRLSYVVPIFIPLMTVVAALLIAVMLGTSGMSKTHEFADRLMNGLQQTAANAFCGQTLGKLQTQMVVARCLQNGGCVQEYNDLLRLLKVGYNRSEPSYYTVSVLMDGVPFLPLGAGGQLTLYRGYLFITDTSACSAGDLIQFRADCVRKRMWNATGTLLCDYGGAADDGEYYHHYENETESESGHESEYESGSEYEHNQTDSSPDATANDSNSSQPVVNVTEKALYQMASQMDKATLSVYYTVASNADRLSPASSVKPNSSDEWSNGSLAQKYAAMHNITLMKLGGTVSMVMGFTFPICLANGVCTAAMFSAWYRTDAISNMLLELRQHMGEKSNLQMAMVTANGSLVAASVSPDLQAVFGTYNSTGDTHFSIVNFKNVPLISEGGWALLEHYHNNLLGLASGTPVLLNFRFDGGQKGMLSASRFLTCLEGVLPDVVPTFLIVLVPWDDFFGSLNRSLYRAGFIGGGFLLLMVLVVIVVLIFLVIRPLTDLKETLWRLTSLNTESLELKHRRGRRSSVFTEISDIESTTQQLEQSLSAFAKYLPRTVVLSLLLKGHSYHRLGMTEKDVSIYFSDIVGFTSISETLPHDMLNCLLREYLAEMTATIIETEGTIDKYIGDAIMAFWNAPDHVDKYCSCAVFAAVQAQERLAQNRIEWYKQGLPLIYQRIGVNCGKVLVGNYGCEVKMDFTIIGDPVNVASRLEGLNKKYGTSIMISTEVYHGDDVSSVFCCRELGRVAVKGKSQWGTVFEVLGVKQFMAQAVRDAAELYTAAVHAYYVKDFSKACVLLDKYAEMIETPECTRKRDPAAQELRERCVRLIARPPRVDEPWDGSEILHEKL